jgi:hypothetical protein
LAYLQELRMQEPIRGDEVDKTGAVEVANLNPAQDERERLIRHICESIRVYTPAQRMEAFFEMKRRLAKTSLEVLRQIIDEDVVNVTAAQLVRLKVGA